MSEVEGTAKEIEKKFLLENVPRVPVTSILEIYEVKHGWVPGTVIKERITKTTRHGVEYWRVIKTGEGIERIEAQEEISEELFNSLYALTEAKRISKTRYVIQDFHDPKHPFELDVFNTGLVLLEKELDTQDQQIEWPSWLDAKSSNLRDVTLDPGYLNYNMAGRI